MSLIPSGEQSAAPENTESAESTVENTESQVTEPKFLFADGVEGTGETPEWFKSNKYKTVADQAKAYTELESRFGAFSGAPKDGK